MIVHQIHVRINWHGPSVIAEVRHRVGMRLLYAASTLRDHAKEKMSIPFVGEKGSPGQASLPGEYPRKRSGHLVIFIQSVLDELAMRARTGTNVLYGRFQQTGTSKMAARPWLTLGMTELLSQLSYILRGGK